MDLPPTVEVVVEVPAGGFVKRGPKGHVDYVSPLPSPFNYGSIPDIMGADGDPLDAVLLGPRRPAGHREQAAVLGRVRFIDDGVVDHKVICGWPPLRKRDQLRVTAFFVIYAAVKRVVHRLKGKTGRTAYEGWG